MAKFLAVFGILTQLMMCSLLLNAEDMDFCHSQLEFISIFNLGDDTIFQDKFKNFWKLNTTEIPTPKGQSFPLTEKKVLVDRQLTKMLDKKFDIQQGVFGFTAIDEDTAQCTTDNTTEEYAECMEVNTDSNIHYTCFFGYNQSLENQTVETYKYNYSELQDIQSTTLKQRIFEYCQNHSFLSIHKNNIQGETDHLVGGLQYYEYEAKYNYTLLRRQILVSPQLNESAVNMYAFYDEYKEVGNTKVITNNQFYVNKIPYNIFVYVFRYNKNLGVFGCPLFCTVKSNLTRINLLKDEGKLNYHSTEVSIQDLIRCPNYKRWESEEFCHQSGFISTFNLGQDIVFQNPGKMWRYISTGANNFGNTYFVDRLQSIRFDTDMNQFLEKYFDTSRVIHGFTYKHILQDICHKSYKYLECQKHFIKYPKLQYLRACIYGEEVYYEGSKMKHRDRVEGFYYTPSGLKVFNSKSVQDETQQFCTKISNSLGADLKLTGVLGDSYSSPDVATLVYAFFKKISNGEIFYYKAIISSLVEAKHNIPWVQITSMKDQNSTRPIDSMNYLWFQSEMLGLSSQNISDTPYFDSMADLSSRYDWETGTFKKFKESIYSIYNCPFKQSYSIAYLEPDPLCTDFTGVFSMFQIHKNVYYQKGRHFYKALLSGNKKRFLFDKYFTDFMNDNFDTRYKVLAYSYPLDINQLRVFIVGKTKNDTKIFGDKYFRSFAVGRSQFSALEALNDESLLYFSKITFGLTDPTLRNTRIDAMFYLDPSGDFFIDALDRDNKRVADRFWLLMLVLNETNLYYSPDGRKFEFPFDDNLDNHRPNEAKWNKLSLNQEMDTFVDVWGMFEHKNTIYAGAWRKDDSKRTMPIIAKVWVWKPDVDANSWINAKNHQIWSFDEYFSCDESERSESDGQSGDGLYFLIILVLLLLMTAAIVGFIAWDKNKSGKTSDQKSKSEVTSEVNNTPTVEPQTGQSSTPTTKETDEKSTRSSTYEAKGDKSSVIQVRSELGD